MISSLIDFFSKPVKLDFLDIYLRKPGVRILDVGCGNHSATRTKKYYPACQYHGLDQSRNYQNSETDIKLMARFFQVDLGKHLDKLKTVPGNYYDVVIASHLIEHLNNGEAVLSKLIPKLKKGGIIYVETPSPVSRVLPHMRGTLNFYDDPTHKKIYPLTEIVSLLKNQHCTILFSGQRRSIKKILFLPAYLLTCVVLNGFVSGHVFWDISGFANVIIARKK